jgi:hypothetical protein
MYTYPKILTVDSSTILSAQAMITACEICDSRSDIPFEWLLSYICGGHDDTVAYFMIEPALCPRCGTEISEDTQVRP